MPPVDTVGLMEHAMARMQEGRASDAETLCKQVLELESDNPDAFYLLGLIEHQRQNNPESLKRLSRAIEIEPGAHWYFTTLSQVKLALGDATGAAGALESGLRLEPNSVAVLDFLGSLYMRLGRFSEAANIYRKLVALAPDRPQHHSNLGASLSALGQTIGAIEAIQTAMRLAPDVPEYPVNLALTLLGEDRTKQAIATLGKVIQQHPDHPDARRALGVVLEKEGEFDLAVNEYIHSLRENPENADVHQRLAGLYARAGQLDLAMKHWSEVMRIQPGHPGAASNMLMTSNYDSRAQPEQLFQAHRTWGERCADPMTQRTAPHTNPRDPERALRVGYVSPDFRNHPIAAFMKPIFEAHRPDLFEAIGFSDASTPDNYTKQLRDLCAGWHDTRALNDEQLTELVRAQRIDVLIDLAGHTAENRLGAFARKPAPVQFSYLGYCNTTGMAAIDRIIGDDVTDPPRASQPYTEQLVRLPTGFSCWSPRPDAPEPGAPPVLRNGFITFGAFHALAKLNESTLDLWARLMAAVPTARLLIWRNTLAGRARQTLHDALVGRGISPNRLELRSERPDGKTHLGMYHSIDIALDSQPWSGHTTSCESTWMGVPFITIRGNTHAGRMAASALTFAQAGEFVAEDEMGFLRIATELAGDENRLESLRQSLRPRMANSKLCDGKAFTAAWETALREAWKQWCAAPEKCT